jgi:hypothetical protein
MSSSLVFSDSSSINGYIDSNGNIICYLGYTLSSDGTTCSACIANCANCDSNSATCSVCNEQFYYDSTTNTCESELIIFQFTNYLGCYSSP